MESPHDGQSPDLETVMRTTFAGRDFTDEPVTDTDIAALLELARFAPSGGNRQGWRVVAVRDPATKRRVIESGLPACRRYVAERAVGHNPLNTVEPSPVTDADVDRIGDDQLGWFLALADAPVLLVIGVDLSVVASMDAHLDRVGVVSGASVYPFVQNVLLAARARGLSGALTTFTAWGETDAQEAVGFPEQIAIAAVVPIGYPTRVLTKLTRLPVETFARFDHWNGRPVIMDA